MNIRSTSGGTARKKSTCAASRTRPWRPRTRRDEAVAGKEAKAVQEVLARNRLEQEGQEARVDREET